ncbi:MAG: SDR family NAD(P)-dependent oxidoreductase, partial [Pseudomonadota bacterium]
MNGLKGKVAVCTGSGRPRGLGAAILRRLAEEGARVVVTDLGAPDKGLGGDNVGVTEDMEQVAADLRALGAEVHVAPCDVRDEAAVKALMASTVEAFGGLDIFVNNAGVGYVMKPLDEVSYEDWKLVIDVNLSGAFLCTKYAAAEMIRAGKGGRIVNIASQAAKSGFPHMASYVASKHGMVGLTRSNAIELGAHGITVNAVCPNHVTTDLGAKQNEYFSKYRGKTVEEYREDLKGRIPLGRIGLASDTAAA